MQTGETPQVQDYYTDLALPTAEDLSFQIEQLVQQGVLSPEDAQAFLIENSAMAGVQSDAATKQAQMDALLGLQEVAQGGGMTAKDRALLSKIGTEEATKAKGAREAIMQQAQARGAGGSGMEILAQLQNQQEATNRASQRDLDVAGMAQERALQALMQQGQLAGQINQQNFGQQVAKAEAQDAIAKFNAQAQQQAGMANVAARNQAQAANLKSAQDIANANASLKTQQNAQKSQIQQQMLENELKKRGGQSGINQTNAQIQGANAQANAQAQNQMLGSAMMAAAYASDENLKTDIEDFNPSDFLDSLTAHKYKYKDPDKHGQGPQVGVMAQDLMKTEAGRELVQQGEDGLMVNTSKAVGPLLASVADLNKRLKKVEGK